MPEESPKKDMSALYTPVAIIIAGALIGFAVYFALSKQTPAATGGPPQGVAVNIKDVKIADEPYIGEKNAPVVLAFWSDFQCPYCKAFETGGVPQIPTPAAMPDIIKQYVDTGKVKVVFKDFAFLGNDSIAAAEYGRSVWSLYPDPYLAWRTAMYKAQDDEGDQGFGDAESIDALIKAQFPKINYAAVRADLGKNKAAYDAAIQADQQEGQKFGINGTPGFVTGTTHLDGAQPFSAFQAAIDPQL